MDSRIVTPSRHRRANHFSTLGLFSGLTGFSELERRIERLETPQERGDAFEVFAEAYLATQKINQAAEVWPDGTIPSDIVKTLKLPPTDMGVDGVYRTLNDDYAAYQVKFRTGRKPQTWKELSTFVGLADRADLKVLFTNSSEVLEVVTDRQDFFCIRGADLDRLTEDELTAIDTWLRGEIVHFEPFSPRPHQAAALDDVLNGLKEHDRVTTVMACGTGKTLTALWMAERLEPQRVLVLLPSLSLVRQTLHEWLKQTRWERPRFLAVCSDPSVKSGTEDTMVVNQADLDFPVTTKPDVVKEFLDEKSGGVQVVFSTYQSAHVVGEAMGGQKPFDLGIFDEAHKTAGREGSRFAFALEDANLPITKRVFMTATPRHYDIRNKDKEGDKKLVYSMDVPEVYGPIVHTLSFAQAAREGIICDFKIIISVVTSEMIDNDLLKHGEVLVDGDPIKARSVATQIALQQACEEHDLRKVFSFHSSVASAKDFTGDTASGIKTHMPDYQTLHVNGAMRTAARETVMNEFRNADRAVISNARCLTEGVDVPAVDVVAFLSPRKSKVDIVQAAGRAMRKSDSTGKEYGYLLLPLFLETEAGESVEDALERTGFNEAWSVLQAMQEQDGELAEIIREMRVERGRTGGFDDSQLRERVEVLGPQVSLEALRESVATSIVEHLGISWDELFGQLVRYKEVHGDCNVLTHWTENPQLGRWMNNTRTQYRKGVLSSERVQRLEALGFEWDARKALWEAMFSALEAYKEAHGDCNVPRDRPENKSLATWVGRQRAQYQSRKLSADRVFRLEALGFVWDHLTSAWEAMFSALETYKEKFGDCNVSQDWSENPQLANWVITQRTQYRLNNISTDRVKRLEALGFVLDPHKTVWEAMFSTLEAYKEAHGDCNVPPRWAENQQLATWVDNQRSKYRRGDLSVDRVHRLDDLGMVWDTRTGLWENRFSELEAYNKVHGDCDVPRRWDKNPQLATWVNSQRANAKKGNLSDERRQRLEALGFDLDPHTTVWEAMFTTLEAYKEAQGDCNVPRDRPENKSLATWVVRQRYSAKKGQLSEERRQRLEAIGFRF